MMTMLAQLIAAILPLDVLIPGVWIVMIMMILQKIIVIRLLDAYTDQLEKVKVKDMVINI